MQLSDLNDKYAGKMGFAIGAGPSLHFLDVNLLNNFVSISVNSAISKVQNSTFFLADDVGVKHWNYYRNILPNLTCTSLLFKEKLSKHINHLNSDKVLFFNHKCWYDPPTKSYHPEGLVLTKDASLPIIGARTSLGSAVHFLYCMGCDPIVLLGCDCCFNGAYRYFWQFPGENKCYRLNGEAVYSRADKGKIKGQPVDSHSISFLNYWRELSKQADTQNIKIIDASGGLLDCFPKMSLEEVLENFGERRINA